MAGNNGLDIIIYQQKEDGELMYVAATSHPEFFISGDGATPSEALAELAEVMELADKELIQSIFNKR